MEGAGRTGRKGGTRIRAPSGSDYLGRSDRACGQASWDSEVVLFVVWQEVQWSASSRIMRSRHY